MSEMTPERYVKQNYNPLNRPPQVGYEKDSSYRTNYDKIFGKKTLLQKISDVIKLIVCGINIKF